MKQFRFFFHRDISSTSGKIKRAMLQFTPESWTHVRWLDPKSTYMRFISVCQLVIFWQVTELNTFFLKHIFEMPPSHPLVIIRLIFVGLFVAPSVRWVVEVDIFHLILEYNMRLRVRRQYYIYATDTRCKRVGTQCWVYGAIMVSEAILCIKNGKELFERTQATNIIAWLLIQMAVSIAFVYGCVLWHKYIQVRIKRLVWRFLFFLYPILFKHLDLIRIKSNIEIFVCLPKSVNVFFEFLNDT